MTTVTLLMLFHMPLWAPSPPTSRPASRPVSAVKAPATVVTHGLRVAPNKRYTIQYNQYYRIQQTAFGKDTKVIRQHNITYSLQRISPPAAKLMTLRMTFARVRVWLRAGLLKDAYDSLRPGRKVPAQAHVLAAYVGRSFTVQLKPDGSVHRVTFSPALQKALQQALKSHPIVAMLRGAPKAALRKQLISQFGPTQWRREMEALWSYLPPQKPTAGSRWRRRSTAPIYGMTQDAIWTAGRTQKTLTLHLRASLTAPRDSVTPFAVGASKHMRYAVKGSAKGTLQLDPKTRLPRTGQIHIRLQGQIQWSPKPNAKPKRTWPLLIQAITTWKPQPTSG